MKANSSLSNPLLVASWLARVAVAVILLQTLFFKFTGAPESVYIFTTVGQEPWGRYGSGGVELIASVLLFVPSTVAIGAALALGTMSGAIFFHLFTPLGVDPYMDGGVLFTEACLVWSCCLAVLVLERHRVGAILARFGLPVPSFMITQR